MLLLMLLLTLLQLSMMSLCSASRVLEGGAEERVRREVNDPERDGVCASHAAAGKEKSLLHFCVDLCFPTNTCITVCLYYSPYF
ncbi:unnamed protein product [Lampetra fluviatilis]